MRQPSRIWVNDMLNRPHINFIVKAPHIKSVHLLDIYSHGVKNIQDYSHYNQFMSCMDLSRILSNSVLWFWIVLCATSALKSE